MSVLMRGSPRIFHRVLQFVTDHLDQVTVTGLAEIHQNPQHAIRPRDLDQWEKARTYGVSALPFVHVDDAVRRIDGRR